MTRAPAHPIVAGNTASTSPENRAFYPALDGLRTVAFVVVFVHHYLRLPWGWLGVNIFFVLSGFLITGILFDTRNDPHRIKNFYVRRTLRIFPLYYAIFLALGILTPILHWQWSWYWAAWPLYLGNFLRFLGPAAGQLHSTLEVAADARLFTPKLLSVPLVMGHFWSLCVEEQFYLIWPFVVFWVRSRKALIWICCGVVITVPIARVLVQHLVPLWMVRQELVYRATPFQLDSLLLGGLIALLWRGSHRKMISNIAASLAPVMLVVSVAYFWIAVGGLTLQHFADYFYHYPKWQFTGGLVWGNILSAALVVCCLRSGNVFGKVLNTAPLRRAGRLTYGAYVFHDMFHDVYLGVVRHLTRHLAPDISNSNTILLTAVLAFFCTYLLAWASFKFLERPFLDLKKRFTRT